MSVSRKEVPVLVSVEVVLLAMIRSPFNDEMWWLGDYATSGCVVTRNSIAVLMTAKKVAAAAFTVSVLAKLNMGMILW